MTDNLNLDVNDIAYDTDGVKNFFWPIKIHSINSFRDDILDALLPILKGNKNLDKHDKVKTPLNILFKWFINDILNIYKSCEIKNRFQEKKINLLIPDRFDVLKKIFQNERPSTIFEKIHKGPIEKFPKLKFMKKIFRFFQINSLKDILNNKKELDTVVFYYQSFLRKNLYGNGEINFFGHFSDYFKDNLKEYDFNNENKFPKSIRLKAKEITKILEKIFLKHNIIFDENLRNYFIEWILECFYFVNFHREKIKNLPKKIYIGSSSSEVWGKMLCNFVLNSGGEVLNFEHGRGDILHDFLPKCFTDLDEISEFITLNDKHSEINSNRLKKNSKFILGDKEIKISFPKKKIYDPFQLENHKYIKKYNNKDSKLKIMYVSTCYLGYCGRLRSTLPDIVYFDFQIRLISFLKKMNFEIICQPHPGGYTKIKKDFFKKLKVINTTKIYDQAIKDYDFDLFITDHVASTTMVNMLLSNKLTILMSFGTPVISEDIENDLNKSTHIINVEFDENNRAVFDEEKLKKIFQNFKLNKETKIDKPIKKFYK